jgi:SAM-dependent methyltransferase
MSSQGESGGYYGDPRIAAAYDAEHAGSAITTDDIPFYLELAKQVATRGQAVLELGCGTGRVTVPIARAGVEVVGLDRSPAMLALAREKAAGLTNLRWVEADMADFVLTQRFGLAIIPFRSFCLLLETERQKACLRCIHAHLAPDGRLALNFFNPNIALIASWLTQRRGLWERIPADGRVERWTTRTYHTARQQIEETRRLDLLGDDGAVIGRATHGARLRYIFRYEMEHLLALCGFEVEALYGWFDGREFSDDSPEMVWLARRA